MTDASSRATSVASIPRSMLGLPGDVLVTGLEDNPDGSLRVYVGPRYKGVYVVIEDAQAQDELRRAFGSCHHLFINTPPSDALCRDEATS